MSDVIFSSAVQLQKIANIIEHYTRLPVSTDAVPGGFLEAALAHVRGAKVMATYDYVDVVDVAAKVAWSVKSTKAATPMTWKRAKIPNKDKLISASYKTEEGLQALGNAILSFCNKHARESIRLYDLTAIGYARLIVHKDQTATYFERLLCTADAPEIFDPSEFQWKWSVEKATTKKEQKSALHGWHKPSGKDWWPPDGDHAITFSLPAPTSKLTFERLIELLETA
jgi:hypothetical protein